MLKEKTNIQGILSCQSYISCVKFEASLYNFIRFYMLIFERNRTKIEVHLCKSVWNCTIYENMDLDLQLHFGTVERVWP